MVKIYVHVQYIHQYIHVTWGNININKKKILFMETKVMFIKSIPKKKTNILQ